VAPMSREPVSRETVSKDDTDILALSHLMASSGRFGIVWLTDELIVLRAYGAITGTVLVGEPISSSVLVLIGQEDRIAALKSATDSKDKQLYLPNIAVVQGDGAPIRSNVTVLHDQHVGFVVVFDRVYAAGLAEMMVEDEIRKRRIADAELARINRQLEEFAYVISHDLKAPIRALRYYSTDIAEATEQEPIDIDAVRKAAGNVQVATKRMSNMLVGLLEYSLIGRQDETIERVDTRAIVDDIAATLALPTGMSLVISGDWPTLRTTPVPLDLVLRNLIDNAVKHHDRDEGRIHATSRALNQMLVVDIADDGPGIPPDWHEAIFKPFNQIDGTRHPESSGIGLALVKRTIEAAGGRIEVISDPAKARGTTFRVLWPKR
jgi:signal transduction histidine kinase